MGDIKSGQKVKIFLDSMDVVLDCTVKNHENDRIVLDFDSSILEYVDYLLEGDEIGVKIFTPVGIIVFDSIVLDSPLDKNFVIECVETSPKIQRRDYARVLFDTKIIIEQANKNLVVAKTIDISGGGVKFLTKEENNDLFKPEERVKITIYMPQDRSINTMATIIDNPHIPKNNHVIQFLDIDESERERIIKKTFELQRACL